MATFDINIDDIDQLISKAGSAFPSANIEKATSKAIRRTQARIQTHVRHQVALGVRKDTGLKLSEIKNRVFHSRKSRRSQGQTQHYIRTWLGTNPVPWSRLNPVSLGRGGVKISTGEKNPKAFMIQKGSNTKVLFRNDQKKLRTVVKQITPATQTILSQLNNRDLQVKWLQEFDRNLQFYLKQSLK